MGSQCCAPSVYDEPSKIASVHWPAFAQGIPPCTGKTIVVTGCTTGFGRILIEHCASTGASIIMANRDSARAKQALTDMRTTYGDKVVHVSCDLASFASVHAAAAEIARHCTSTGIDVLCNNAGIMAFPNQATGDGCDIQMQSNHLSHFLLTKELFPLLAQAAKKNGEARIVHHSSGAAFLINKLEAKYFQKNGGNLGDDAANGPVTMSGPAWERYAQSKAANAAFTFALRDRIAKANAPNVIAACCAPGVAATELQVKAVGQGGMSPWTARQVVSQSAEDGTMGLLQCVAGPCASGEVWGPAGMMPGGNGMSGKIVKLNWETAGFLNDEARQMVWEESERTTGCEFVI